MASTPRQQYERERQRLDDANENGDISPAEYDAITTFLDARDETCIATPAKGIKTTDSGHSLRSYANTARKVAERLDDDLTDTTADAINQLMGAHLNGRHPDVKDGGLSERTISSYQGVIRKFYEYHDFGITPADVEIVNPGRTPVDKTKLFTQAEIEAMRDAIDNQRDRCLFELLLNTGQRIGAIQSLRVQDVDPQNGVFWLNPNGELKGADRNGRKRPLLGAKRAVYDWVKNHPTGEPDDYLITNLPTWSRGPNAGEMLSQQSINRIVKAIGERAGVPKEKLHAHNFRHTFVTIAYRDYDLSKDEIRWMIGHAKDSKVMEATYSHLDADDYTDRVQAKTGEKEPEEPATLTPNSCPTCGEVLADGAKACPACGEVFTPDAAGAPGMDDTAMAQQFAKMLNADDTAQLEQVIRNAFEPELRDVFEEELDGDDT